MANRDDLARWKAEVSPHGDLAEAVRSGSLRLKDAAREARSRERSVHRQTHNALLEAEYEEGWRRAPLMTCPRGHSHLCQACAEEFRFDGQS
jgi:hypothetical protein